MKRFQIAASIAIIGLGLSIPALAADTAKPKDDQPSTQSGKPDATTGQGQTGKPEASQADTAKPKSDQPSTQSGPLDATTGEGQTGQTDPSKADPTKPKSENDQLSTPTQSDTSSTGASAQAPITVQLQPKGNSGVSGTATLTPQGKQTRVVVQLKGPASNVAQPAHFHSGTCDKLDPKPKFPLADLVNGTSTSVVSAPVSELASGKYTINVHKSAAEVKTSVACGNVKS
jgi:hypothetical protein